MKTNKEKFQEMNKKQKMEYIGEYYKWHILGVMVLIAVAVSLIKTMTAPPEPVHSLNIAVAGKFSADEQILADVQQAFINELDVKLDWQMIDWEYDVSMAVAIDTKLMAMASVGELQGYLISETKFNAYQNSGNLANMFYPLDEIESLNDFFATYDEKKLITDLDENGIQHIYGIKADTVNGLENVVFGETFVYTLFANQENEEVASALTQKFFAN
jgi:hypothetical protein